MKTNLAIKYNDTTLKPENLITFTEQYKLGIDAFKQQLLKACIDSTPISVTSKRLDLKKGTFTSRENYGKILSVNGVTFEMHIEYTISEGGGKTVLHTKQIFRFDSYLGEIPVPAADVIPCELNHELNKGYASFLEEFKYKMKPYIGQPTKFNFLYNNFFIENMKDYYMSASITEINVSNFRLIVKYSHGFTESGYYYNTIEREVIRPFLTPTTMFVGIAA